MFVPRLARGPGLQLMHRIAGGVEVMVLGDLGQLSGMAPALSLVLERPGLEFRIRTPRGWPVLICSIGWQGEVDSGHGRSSGIHKNSDPAAWCGWEPIEGLHGSYRLIPLLQGSRWPRLIR